MKIALIGAGNVATHLGQALAKAGSQIIQVYSRTENAAKCLSDELCAIYESMPANKSYSETCSWTTCIESITTRADLYLVMLKDSVLDDFLPNLVKCNPNGLFVHTAGSIPMDIWNGQTKRFGVLYPMQTFSKGSEVDFQNVHFFIEANSENDTQLLKNLATLISSHVFEASSEQRKYLHLSAVFACNFTNHMYAICNELLTAHGLPFSSMLPLIDETARKVHHLNPKEAQTGPAQRNDTNVMTKQENLLKDDAKVAELYRLISQHIVSYQEEKTNL